MGARLIARLIEAAAHGEQENHKALLLGSSVEGDASPT